MKNKRMFRLLALLLLLAVFVTAFAGCKKKTSDEETTTTEVAETPEESPFFFEKTDHNCDFTFLRPSNIYKDFSFTDTGVEGTDLIKDALARRDAMVEEYIGVTIKSATVGGIDSIYPTLNQQNMSGDHTYQAALTHCYMGINSLVTEKLLYDFYDMEDINLDADYWNLEAVEALEVGGKAYLALNDFMINDPTAVFFNKSMMSQYNIEDTFTGGKSVYDVVRDGDWTLDKLMEITSSVHVSNGDDIWDKNDTYGFAAMADWPFLSLINSCEIEWLDPGPGYRLLRMSSANERYETLFEKVAQFCDAETTYLWNYGESKNQILITDNRILFTFTSLKNAYSYRESEISFGILPYPKFDTNQEQYRSFDWSGMICVPADPGDINMVGQTLECLAAYSEDTIRVAYYEKLLGKRLADAPDYAEMIIDYIFVNIVLNPTINYIGQSDTPLGELVYTLARMTAAKAKNTDVDDISSKWASYHVAAQQQINATLNSKFTQ